MLKKLKRIWSLIKVWAQIPHMLSNHKFKELFRENRFHDDNLGYHMTVKEQRVRNTKLKLKLRRTSELSVCDMLAWQTISLNATQPEEIEDIKESLRSLIGIAIDWYVNVDRLSEAYIKIEQEKKAAESTEFQEKDTPDDPDPEKSI